MFALGQYGRNDQFGDKAFTDNAMCVNEINSLLYYIPNDYYLLQNTPAEPKYIH